MLNFIIYTSQSLIATRFREDLSELRNCVKIEVAVLGSLSLIVRTVSVDVKHL